MPLAAPYIPRVKSQLRDHERWSRPVFMASLVIVAVALLLIMTTTLMARVLPLGGDRLLYMANPTDEVNPNSLSTFSSIRDVNWEIFVLDVRTGNSYNLTRNAASDRFPQWSPDGTKIAFHSNRHSGAARNFDIYVMDADGKNVQRLTTHEYDDAMPQWSPDGTMIAYHSYDLRTGEWDIYVMNADGSNVRKVVGDLETGVLSDESMATWSPDSTQIAFTSGPPRTTQTELYIVNIDGTNLRQLTDNDDHEWAPSWSPDGTQIAFQSDRNGGNSDIYVYNLERDTVRQLTDLILIERAPEWLPDGSGILYEVLVATDYEIFVMNPDGSNKRRLTDSNLDNLAPSWQPG
ncbi:MAG: hypothetical protein D6737_09610 [Chloroflexi bacterium]|nr:MAG: hypothetical protein D6737_09610 [Chloroflexota bacterium]